MKQTLPLARWLTAPRPDDTPIAWLDESTWTLGDLRHDVAQLICRLQQQPGERWALCFENSYLFIVALLATLHAGKTPVLRGITALSSLMSNVNFLMVCLATANLTGKVHCCW